MKFTSILFAMLLASPALAQQPNVAAQEVVTFSVTQQELGVIGDGLGQLPFNRVAPVIQRLNEQLAAARAKAEQKPESQK